jgi:hypothetical protein
MSGDGDEGAGDDGGDAFGDDCESGAEQTPSHRVRTPGAVLFTNILVGHADPANWSIDNYRSFRMLLQFIFNRLSGKGGLESCTLSYGVDASGTLFLIVVQRIGRTLNSWTTLFQDPTNVITNVQTMKIKDKKQRYTTYLKNFYGLTSHQLDVNEQHVSVI